MSRALKVLLVLCLAVAMSAFVAACDDEEEGGGGSAKGGAAQGTNLTEGTKGIDPASMDNAKGEVTY